MNKSKHKYTKITILSIILLFTTTIQGQKVDTITVYSNSMKKPIKNLVILPASYTKTNSKKYSVVYLLHGYNNRYDGWIKKTKPDLPEVTSQFDFIVVCPDGSSSWYLDSPINPESKYETYISRELIKFIDSNYNTKSDRTYRAITGYSMGGYGALWLALKHPDIFGACGSMSGGVDIRPFPNNWKIKEQLGNYEENKKVWDEHCIINQLYRLTPYTDQSREVASKPTLDIIPFEMQNGELSIIIDCGTDDYFYKVNEELHKQMLYYNIRHEYITRPGKHTHNYWRNAVDFQFLFFKKYFNANNN